MTVAQDIGTDDRRLLAEVSKWAHANGWTNGGWRGYMNGRYSYEATIFVRPNETGFMVGRKETGEQYIGRAVEYSATSVREAVDLLVALRILPDRFSSAFDAGVDSCSPTIRRLIHGLVFGSAAEFVRLREQVAPSVSVRSGDAQAEVPADDWPLPAVEIEDAEAAGLVVRPDSPAASTVRPGGPARAVAAAPGASVQHWRCGLAHDRALPCPDDPQSGR